MVGASCRERHVLTPFSSDAGGATTTVTQNLTLYSEGSSYVKMGEERVCM